MRLAIVIVLALTSTAAARVVMTPAIPRTCRAAESWDEVVKCLGQFGEPKVERELTGAKLVSIASPKFRIPGLYIYRQSGKQWVIAGMFDTSGTFEVFAFTRPTIAKRTGYRFDVGVIEDASSGDGRRSIVQQKISVFCSALSYTCSQVTTSCDYIVDGRARESFRGKLTVKGDNVKVSGDRSRSGSVCVAAEDIALGFGPFADD